jgi:hypothetical protein
LGDDGKLSGGEGLWHMKWDWSAVAAGDRAGTSAGQHRGEYATDHSC